MSRTSQKPVAYRRRNRRCSGSKGNFSMDTTETREKLIALLEVTMGLAQRLGDPTTTYLIERALDEARSRQVPKLLGPSRELH